MKSTGDLITQWLLTSNIVIADGPHKGAVAGWLTEDGFASFAYPEITGYYLTWLAHLENSEWRLDKIQRARDAACWLSRISSGELPLLTRYHRTPDEDDWRNHALFTFDLTMAALGLSDCQRVIDEDLAREPLQHLCDFLDDASRSEEGLPACLRVQGELPARWSTQPGPYQLKPAAALLFGLKGTPRLLRKAAWNTYDRWRRILPEVRYPEDLHPALYAVEGRLEFARHGDGDVLEIAQRELQDILSMIDHWPTGGRSDVVAQALQLSCRLGIDTSRIAVLRRYIHEFLDGGRVSFRPLRWSPVHWNAWSAMFTHDALEAHEKFSLRHTG